MPSEEESNKEAAKSLYKAVLWGLCLPSGQLSDIISPHLTYPGTLPWGVHKPLYQEGVSE